MEPNQLKWTYRVENQSDGPHDPADWIEIFETTFEEKPVEVVVRAGCHPLLKQLVDGLFLRIYSDTEKKEFIGLIAESGRDYTTSFVNYHEFRLRAQLVASRAGSLT
jgi:hypothetical protein